MKQLLVLLGLVLSMFTDAQKTPAKTTTAAIKLTSANDTLQYTLGAFVAQWINSNGFLINNPSLFLKGMDDMFQNKPRQIPDSTIGPRIAAYQQVAKRGRAIQQEQQLFSSIKDRPGVGMFPNGVRYIIIKSGKGARPTETDSIDVHLIAKLPDGTVVDDTYQANKPFTTTPAGFFPGLNESLQSMPEGAKWQLFIPSVLAYGDKGLGVIPPNSALIIDIELLAVRPPKK